MPLDEGADITDPVGFLVAQLVPQDAARNANSAATRAGKWQLARARQRGVTGM